ncbi:MAG: HNH endonuclease [Candidatus Geothermincolia bacterium]
MAARDRIRCFFENNVGRIITTQEIREVAGISEYARRIRELRNEEGMQIRSYRDRADLKPNEYVLETLERLPKIDRTVPQNLRMEILVRNGFTCQLCGAGPADPDPYHPGRKVRLTVDHIVPASQGGGLERDNLRATCSVCNESKRDLQPPSESALNILARIRKEPRNVQRDIYDALKRTFGEH